MISNPSDKSEYKHSRIFKRKSNAPHLLLCICLQIMKLKIHLIKENIKDELQHQANTLFIIITL